MMALVTPAIAAEIERLLKDAGVTQYQLRTKAKLSANTARILLGLKPGLPSLDSADRALALIGKKLWHAKRPRS